MREVGGYVIWLIHHFIITCKLISRSIRGLGPSMGTGTRLLKQIGVNSSLLHHSPPFYPWNFFALRPSILLPPIPRHRDILCQKSRDCRLSTIVAPPTRVLGDGARYFTRQNTKSNPCPILLTPIDTELNQSYVRALLPTLNLIERSDRMHTCRIWKQE
jgi:hypothetical protein